MKLPIQIKPIERGHYFVQNQIDTVIAQEFYFCYTAPDCTGTPKGIVRNPATCGAMFDSRYFYNPGVGCQVVPPPIGG